VINIQWWVQNKPEVTGGGFPNRPGKCRRPSYNYCSVFNKDSVDIAAFPHHTRSSAYHTEWLPTLDEVRTFFASLSEEIADTIAVIQGVMAA
jgi:hypothetical protein